MTKSRKLIIIGDSAFAEVAYEYFTHDSPYEVAGFSVEQAYLKKDRLFGLPVVPFEELPRHFSPDEYEVYAALVYTQLNRLRSRLSTAAKGMGFRLASYCSSRASVWPGTKLGEHTFIFEANVLQPFVSIGDDTVLWSGNHIGHHSSIGSHCFIASHVVVSGFCAVGDYSFLGVNATLGNNVTVGRDCLIGAGAVVVKDVADDTLVKGNLSDLQGKISARRFMKVPGDAS